jgi:hypothetical protein
MMGREEELKGDNSEVMQRIRTLKNGINRELVRFQVLTAASMKMAVNWVVGPCSLVEVYRHFRGAYTLMMKAASTSETSVNFYQTARRNNPEDNH